MMHRNTPPLGANFIIAIYPPLWDFQYNVTTTSGVVCRVFHVSRHRY